MTPPEIRKQQVKALKHYYKVSHQQFEEWAKRGYKHPPPVSISFPENCRGMKCEEKTRAGRPCKNDGTSYANGRYKFHGGASTGPITEDGKKRSAANHQKRTSCTPDIT